MSIFYPAIMLRSVSDIQPELLGKLGIEALILDVDNTLTTHNNPVPDAEVLLWLDKMRESGIKLIIASNNKAGRVRPFAEVLQLDYASRAMKPLPAGFRRVSGKLGLKPESFGVVGDQIFTDILGGNLFGAKTILVQPMESENGSFFRLKRRLEVLILKRYHRKISRKGQSI